MPLKTQHLCWLMTQFPNEIEWIVKIVAFSEVNLKFKCTEINVYRSCNSDFSLKLFKKIKSFLIEWFWFFPLKRRSMWINRRQRQKEMFRCRCTITYWMKYGASTSFSIHILRGNGIWCRHYKLNSRTLSVAAVTRNVMRRYSAGYYIEYADLSNVLFLRLHPRIACINGCCRI